MVERKTTRSYRIDGADYVAIKTDEFINGKDKKIIQTMEEHNISMEEIDEVIDTLADAELEKVNTERDKLTHELQDLKTEIKDDIKTNKYLKFKEQKYQDKLKKMFSILSKEKTIMTGESRMKELDAVNDDIVTWKTQFIQMKAMINNPHLHKK